MTGLIEVKLTELNQLFNSMDPSPFHERDLDHDAEEFIVSWAQEHPKQHDLKLLVHLTKHPADVGDAQKLVADSVAHYFEYRADMALRELKRLMREGRVSLFVGLLFLALCQALMVILLPLHDWDEISWSMGIAILSPELRTFLREGLTIIGWVAMWKPLDIYLYRWWPPLSRRRLYQRLSRMPVEVRCSLTP
jgi:hypothetical protein